MYTYSHLNTRGVGRIRDSHTNPRRSRGFAQLSRILPTKTEKKKETRKKKSYKSPFIEYFSKKKNRQIRENAVYLLLDQNRFS